MANLYANDRIKLHQDFRIAMSYFNLPKDVQSIAWDSAQKRPVAASRCYRAIVSSLQGGK